MGSFVKGWIWIWLFSNTLSLGLSLLWELASRTYRQPTKGYTAGKVIPKADLWISHQTNWSFCSVRDWMLDFLTQDRPQSIYICDWFIYDRKYGTKGLKINKNIIIKYSILYYRKWEFFVKAHPTSFLSIFTYSSIYYSTFLCLFPIEIGRL